jgi:hypothetical protein
MQAQIEISYMKSFFVGHVDYFQNDDEPVIEAVARMIKNSSNIPVRARNIKIIKLTPSDTREVILKKL